MKKVYLSILSLAMATLFLGCSSDSAATSYLEGSPATITTVEEASNTLTTVSSLSDVSAPSLAIAKTAAALTSKAPSLTLSLETELYTCSGGGTMTYDGTSTSFSVVANNCIESGMTMDGSAKISGDTATFSNFTMSFDGMSFKMNITITDINFGEDVTMNGTMEMADSTGSASLGYQNFHVITRTDGKLNINGDISINSTQFPCNNGTFSISTIVDLSPDYLYGGFSAGTMKVNGVTFTFLSDVTVDVTFADGTTENVTQGLASICTAN